MRFSAFCAKRKTAFNRRFVDITVIIARCSYKELLRENGIEATGDALSVRMNANETKLFEITKL